MYLLIIYISFFQFFILFFFGKKIGNKGLIYINYILFSLMIIILLFCFISVFFYNNIINYLIYNWLNLGLIEIHIGFIFDKITITMLFLIIIVSFFVHLFSNIYMFEEPHFIKFISFLYLFTFFMIILVSSNNLLQLFIGWEGVGLCSYLLINFWYTRIESNKSAIKAILVNKIGDIGLLLAIIFIIKISGFCFYFNLFPLFSLLNLENFLNFFNFLLFIGVIGKSAQIGLHMWLPDAMEGPTPVSALIHAATMVTAGVFLIIRLSPLFEQTPIISILIILFGSLTTFISASIGLFQNDIKKVIAYSTCSQLGYMICISGFSYYDLSLFHLFNHGFFKALLFLGSGSIIYSASNEQDIRSLGNLIFYHPITYISLLIASLSLLGLPFLSGYYSKDLLLELIFQNHLFSFALWFTTITTFITSLYSFKIIYYSFYNYPFFPTFNLLKENSNKMLFPLFILLLFSIFIGFFSQYYILNLIPPVIITNFSKFLPTFLGLFGFLCIFLLLIYLNISSKYINIYIYINIFYTFFIKLYYFDFIINFWLIKPFLHISKNYTYKLIDTQFLESVGPEKITYNIKDLSAFISIYHNGKITTYIFYLIFIFLIIVFYWL